MKLRFARLARIALRLSPTLLAASTFAGGAYARPGGGGSYHSSGGGGGFHSSGSGGGFHSSGGFSSGGGSYGGSSGGGSVGGFFFQLLVVVVVLALIFAYLAVKRALEQGRGQGRNAILDAEHQAHTRLAATANLDTLTLRDPALTWDGIVARVHRMSSVLREAWCSGDMRPARPFVSDGVFSRFQVQLGLMRGEGNRNVMSDAEVLFVTLEGVESAPPLDVLHVRFTARARDVMIKASATEADAAHALKRAACEEYTEIWSLVRRHGALTSRIDPGQVGLQCPSCGAPFAGDTGETIKCRYCNALVCSGEHDWVLAEITQLSEWQPAGDDAEGVAEFRLKDPQLTAEVLEDRASYVFWKWVEAGRRHEATPLRKCATEDFLGNRAQLASIASLRDVAVGGAEVVFSDPDPGDGVGVDFMYVLVFWSAIFGQGEHQPVRTVVRLARKSGVVSVASMTALVCNHCGAPLQETDSPVCDHCNAPLAAGEQSWVLDAMEAAGTFTPRRRPKGAVASDDLGWMMPRIEDPRERQALFVQMARVMAMDGTIAPRERRLLQACAERWNIPREQVDACLARGAGQPGDTLREVPAASASPDWFLAGLVAAAMADGRLDREERALLDRACAAMRLPPDRVDAALRAFDARARAAAGAGAGAGAAR